PTLLVTTGGRAMYDSAMISLQGPKGIVTGLANDQSIAWGCAEAFRWLGRELAIIPLNEGEAPCRAAGARAGGDAAARCLARPPEDARRFRPRPLRRAPQPRGGEGAGA